MILLSISKNCKSTICRIISTVLAVTCSRFLTPILAIAVSNLLFLCGLSSAGVAQLVEHLICNQRVGGSIPSASSTIF